MMEPKLKATVGGAAVVCVLLALRARACVTRSVTSTIACRLAAKPVGYASAGRLCFSITRAPSFIRRSCFKTPGATVGQECPTYSGRRMGILARRHAPVLKQLLKHDLQLVKGPDAHVLSHGGAGFIGSHSRQGLDRRGDRVRVLDNLTTGLLSNLEGVRDQMEFLGPIWWTAPRWPGGRGSGLRLSRGGPGLGAAERRTAAWLPMPACVTGTLTLLDAARRAGVRRLVYAASSNAYGDQPSQSKRETDLPAPISPYGVAKLAAEH